MKRILLVCVGMVVSITGLSLDVPDLSTFKDLTAIKDNTSFFAEDFEHPNPNWKLGKNCRIEKQSGLTGSTALLCERTEKNDYDSAVAKIKLNVKPGHVYKVSAWFRTENVDGKALLHSPCIEFCENGKYVNMINPHIRPAAKDSWQKAETQFTASNENNLIVRMFYDITGKSWWDDIRVEEVGSNQGIVYPLQPVQLLLDDKGTLEFKAYAWEFPPEKLADHAVLFEMNGIRKIAIPDKSGNVRVEFGPLKDGDYPCKAFLLNLKNKTIVAKGEYTFRRIEKLKKQSYLDKYNRLIVDGKPFLPVGVFYTWVRTEKDLQRIADGGFNFILTYTPNSLNIQPEMNETAKLSCAGLPPNYGSPEWKANIRRSLDLIMKYKLKLLGFPVDENFRHPVLIGTYTADEVTIAKLPGLTKTREKYLKVFPGFPVIALTDKPSDYIPYSQCLDILGIDPYPILTKDSRSMLVIRKCLEETRRTGKPVMFVPQAFNWGAYKNEEYSRFVSPTEEQLRSMVLLPVIYEVKWFCFYSYTGIFERMEAKQPGAGKAFWPVVVQSAKLLRELEPWILSLEKAPEVRIKNQEKTVIDAKAFSVNGKTCVIITSCGPGQAQAVITVPGKNNLKSRFGHTKFLGKGDYLFTGTDIVSDVLFE